MYELQASKLFIKEYKKLVKKDVKFRLRMFYVLQKLRSNPKDPSLKSHKVTSKNYESAWSSSVTGDIRIIWDYDKDENLIILLLDIGGHSGKKKVYK